MRKPNPLISIIIPVYGVENYLDRCVLSVVNQTYSNLEIILVDDGSPDNCPAMCDALAEKDSRIKVIHKENGGLSDARNAGMTTASGELMGFIDSDDWISPDMYQLLYENMLENDSDISACGVEMVFEDGTPCSPLTGSGCCVLATEEAMEAVIQESWLKQPVWYKLYKTDLIRDLAFPVGKYHEDAFWTYQAIGRARRVSVFDKPCYFYLQRHSSIMGEGYSLKRLDGLEAKALRAQYIEQHFPSLIPADKCERLFACMYAMQQSLRHLHGAELKTAKKRIREIFSSGKPYRKEQGLSRKQCIWFYLAQISFTGTCRLRNCLKIGF